MSAIVTVTFAFILSAILWGTLAADSLNCTDCIVINNETGIDKPSCLRRKSYIACKTFNYTLSNAILDNTEILLEGDLWLNHTVILSQVEGLTVQGIGSTAPTIHCPPLTTHSSTGYGLVLRSFSNLKVSHVIIEGCGTIPDDITLKQGVTQYRSAVYIINSTNINFTGVTFQGNMGKGLSMYDVSGYMMIANSTFSDNTASNEELFGGGGLSIHCAQGHTHCIGSVYIIKGCMFNNNTATKDDIKARLSMLQLRELSGSYGDSAGQGGGIRIGLKGNSENNSITIEKCSFHDNVATFGGGIDVVLQNNSDGNNITVSGCDFVSNTALEGGAMNLEYTSGASAAYSVKVQDTSFDSNCAGRGGGAVSFSSSYFGTNIINKLEFIHCCWTNNSALIGAAVSFRPYTKSFLFHGRAPTPLLQNCSFTNNHVIKSEYSEIDGIRQYVLETGALHIDSMEVKFNESAFFAGTTGSAIFATLSKISVLNNTEVYFINNRAAYGGAIALLDFSVLEVYPGSQVTFDSNIATELGGAVYTTSSYYEFSSSHKCFISHYPYELPENWTAILTFSNNTANYGHAIYADSLLTCKENWELSNYPQNIEPNIIATSPASINFSLPSEISPGEKIDIKLVSLDELEQPTRTAYQVFMDIVNGTANTNPYISDDDYLEISGQPGTVFNIKIQTLSTRRVSFSRSARLGNCPIGFTLVKGVCVCSSVTVDKQLIGIEQCNVSYFRALLLVGSWIGCSGADGDVATGYCPLKYCNFNDRQNFLVPKTCEELVLENMCFEHRRGQLCGECEEGYSVYYHSDIYLCGKCSYGALGMLIYLAAELFPLTVLFSVIMLMKLKMTSGPMQSLLFFAQAITLINGICSFSTRSQTSYQFIKYHTFIVGFLKLDFFVLNELSFCLWGGATTLDNLAMRYFTTFFALLLIIAYILALKHNAVVMKIICCKKLKIFTSIIRASKNAAVHGISTFLILSYTQYTVTSFRILSRLPLYGEGGKTIGHVVHLQGNVDYFGRDHLPYAIPAVFVLLIFSIPPPFLLISYPLLWKIKAKFRPNADAENDTTVWPIRKILPLIDSFQGVFRDNRRMFAGLLFVWRVILTAIFAFSRNIIEFYVLTECALLSFLVIHAVARPYKRRIYNVIDTVMFANLATIIALYWYNASNPMDIVTGIILLLMYLPLAILIIVAVLWSLQKCNITPKQLRLPAAEEDGPNTAEGHMLSMTHKATFKQKHTCTDDDLFNRAAESNNTTSSVLTCNEVGFELQSYKTTITTVKSI